MIAHSSPRWFSIGVPVIATRRRARSSRSDARALRLPGSSRPAPRRAAAGPSWIELQRLDVARGDVVRRDHDVDARCALERAPSPASRSLAVMQVHAQRRREALDLVHPLARDAHRADDERRPERSAPNSSRSETSIAIACTVFPSPMSSARIAPIPRSPSSRSQPWPALLEREQLVAPSPAASAAAGSARRRRAGSRALVERDLAELEARTRRSRGPTTAAHEIDDAAARLAPLEEPQRARRRRRGAARASGRSTWTTGAFAAASARSSSSSSSTSPTREPPVELRESRRRQQRRCRHAHARSGSRGCASARAPTPSAAAPARRALEQRHQVAQEERRVLGVELDRRSAPPRRTRSRARRAAARAPRAARRDRSYGSPVAQEREAPSLPCQRSDAGSAHVGSSAACSHSSSCERIAPAALVEVEAERPRRLDQPAESLVDPARDPPLERGVRRAVRQLGLGRRRGRQEASTARERPKRRVDRAGRRRRPAGRARSGRRAAGRGRRRSPRGRRGSTPRSPRAAPPRSPSSVASIDVVERRAPERVPAAAAVRELRDGRALRRPRARARSRIASRTFALSPSSPSGRHATSSAALRTRAGTSMPRTSSSSGSPVPTSAENVPSS